MIILKKIRYKNFLSTGNIFTEIELNSNKTTLLYGKNGEGKSTVVDAICFALFGKPFRNINKSQIINSITNKNLLTEIEFTSGNDEYMIRRGMKPNTFEIHKNGKFLNQSAETKDFQEILEKTILKINYKSFCQRVILGSANFTPFMQLPTAARRNFIEDLLDIQIFTTMNTILKDKISKNKNQLSETEKSLEIAEKVIEVNNKHKEQLKQQNQETIINNNKQIEEYTNSNVKIQKENDKLNLKLNKLQEQYSLINNTNDKQNKINNTINKLNDQIEQYSSEMDFYKKSTICSTCEQTINTNFKETKLSELNNSIQENKDKINKLNEVLSETKKKLEKFKVLNEKIHELNTIIQSNNNSITVNNRTIKSLLDQNNKLSLTPEIVNDQHYHDQILELSEKKKILLEQRELNNVALMMLKDDGIKTQIIKQYIPVINKSINQYLDKMEFFCKFEIDENFNEKIKSRHRDEFSYSSFSEGEKTRIDLALLFTWREIAKIRNSSSINLLILDEVMDGSLDSSGTDEFLNIISRFTKENNVFIISHKTDQIMDKFDRTIKFEKIKNFSRIAKEIK